MEEIKETIVENFVQNCNEKDQNKELQNSELYIPERNFRHANIQQINYASGYFRIYAELPRGLIIEAAEAGIIIQYFNQGNRNTWKVKLLNLEKDRKLYDEIALYLNTQRKRK